MPWCASVPGTPGALGPGTPGAPDASLLCPGLAPGSINVPWGTAFSGELPGAAGRGTRCVGQGGTATPAASHRGRPDARSVTSRWPRAAATARRTVGCPWLGVSGARQSRQSLRRCPVTGGRLRCPGRNRPAVTGPAVTGPVRRGCGFPRGAGRGNRYRASRVSPAAQPPRAGPGPGSLRPARCEGVTVTPGTTSHRAGYRGGAAARDRAARGTAEAGAENGAPGSPLAVVCAHQPALTPEKPLPWSIDAVVGGPDAGRRGCRGGAAVGT